MQSVIAGSRVSLTAVFTLNGAVFDPQIVRYESVFVASTIGVDAVGIAYVYDGISAGIVRTDLGVYHVDVFFELPGKLKLAWRSMAWGEELTVEETVAVMARTVVV